MLSRKCWQKESSAPQAPAASLPPLSQPSWPAVGKPRDFTQDFRDPRPRTAGHRFTQTFHRGVFHSDKLTTASQFSHCSTWGCFLLLGRQSQAPSLCKALCVEYRTCPAPLDGPCSHQHWVLLLHRSFRKFIYFLKCIEGGFAVAPGRILDFVEICPSHGPGIFIEEGDVCFPFRPLHLVDPQT